MYHLGTVPVSFAHVATWRMREGSVTVDRKVRTGRLIGAGRPPTEPIVSLVLVAGAALLIASAAIHLNLWASGYRNTKTIGPLFFVQGVFGILFALLISVIRRVAIALLGVLFAAGTIAGLLVSVHFGLAGYWSHMNAPWAVTSLVVEGAAIVVLCVGSGLAVRSERAHVRRWRPSGDAEP